MPRAIVTGGSGFLGRYVVELFERHGWEVISIDRKPDAAFRLDLTDWEATKNWFKGWTARDGDVVVHLAALAGAGGSGGNAESAKDPRRFLAENIDSTINICEAARISGITKMIFMASFASYGQGTPTPINEETPMDPRSAYGRAKSICEQILVEYARMGVRSIILRAPMICGPRQVEVNIPREFARRAFAGEELVLWGDGQTLRALVHPEDVARAIMLSAEYIDKDSIPYDTFVLGNRPISLRVMANTIVKKIGSGSVIFDATKQRLSDHFVDYSKAARLLKWDPQIGPLEIIDMVIEEERALASLRA